MGSKLALDKEQKAKLIRICVSLAAFVVLFAVDKAVGLSVPAWGANGWLLPLGLYLAVYLAIGYDVLWRAVRNIARGQVFDENFLMCVATLGAFALAIYRGVTGQSIEGFDEACAVLLFYQVGEFFQDYATERSRRSIAGLMDIRPDYANVLRNGAEKRVAPEEVAVGEIIVVNAGEKVPLDGVVTLGETALDTKALTGESLPREVREGGEVLSGAVNLSSRIEVRVEKEFYDSTVSKILDLVENAAGQKSRTENFITRFARYYTPTVVITALLLAIIPGAVTGEWSEWVYRALNFLVVSCPCALVISVPLGFFAGIGAASSCGVLVKGSNFLEKMNKADIFVFDKTGTLTKGNFAVTEIAPAERREEILRLAAIAEHGSAHPIARSVLALTGESGGEGYVQTVVPGEGVVASKGEDVILAGNAELMRGKGVDFLPSSAPGTVVYVAHNGEFVGLIVVNDEIKPESAQVVSELNELGCRTVMLTGDGAATAKSVADAVGVTDYAASLLPQEKVAAVEKLLAEKQPSEALCFVGDGINDAPVLMRSDIGIAMGGVGSDAAIEASDIVLMHDDLAGLPLVKRIAKKTMTVAGENIIFSLVVKVAILILSALGVTGMWAAVFGDVGVAVIAVLNAMRINTKRARAGYRGVRRAPAPSPAD